MNLNIYNYVEAALARFRDVWQFDDFWRRGNTYHAYLRFCAGIEQHYPTSPLVKPARELRQQLIAANTEYFRAKSGQPGFWADDFGWWGMALVAAHDALLAAGDAPGAGQQLALARQAWGQMLERGYDSTDTARPVPHGCANSAPETPYGPKNTVTNAGLFLLSVRLYRALAKSDPGAAQQCLGIATAQAQWFEAWFNGPQGYLRTFANQTYGLAQERPIAPPSYENKSHPTWEPGWTWSGDQGLLLAALAEYAQAMSAGGASQPPSPAFARIALGVRQLLCGPDDAVLREAPFSASFGPDYGSDYVAGRGVLMRYLSEPSVRLARGAPFAPEVVHATTAAVWKTRDTATNQFSAEWTPGNNLAFNRRFREIWGNGDVDVNWDPNVGFEGVRQAAGLDVLSAAMALL